MIVSMLNFYSVRFIIIKSIYKDDYTPATYSSEPFWEYGSQKRLISTLQGLHYFVINAPNNINLFGWIKPLT